MLNCILGLFEYELVYIDWLLTSVGAGLGFLGGIGIGLFFIFCAIPVHYLILCMMSDDVSFFSAFWSFRKNREGNGSEVSSVSLDVTGDWPVFNIPNNWSKMEVKSQSLSITSHSGETTILTTLETNLHTDQLDVATIQLPCLPLTVAELLSCGHNSVMRKGHVAIFQASQLLSNDVFLLTILCEGFSLLRHTLHQNGCPNSVSVQEVTRETEEAVNELKLCLRNRESVFLSLPHQGFEKTVESYLLWEKEWLHKSYQLVVTLYSGMNVLDGLWTANATSEEDPPDLKQPWSQFQTKIVQAIEMGNNKWIDVVFPLEDNLLDESVKQRTGFEKQMKHSVDAVLDTVRVCVKESDLSDHMKERVLTDASTYLGNFKSKCYKSGLTTHSDYCISLDVSSQSTQFQDNAKNRPLPHDILDRFTERFYSSCQTHFVQNAKLLVQSFEESFSSQQSWQTSLMKELESLEWILNSKEHRHFSTLKQSMKDKTSDVLAGASDNWQKKWADWRQKMKDTMNNATDYFCLAKTVDESASEVVQQTTLAGFSRAAKSSIEVMNETVRSIEPTLQLKSVNLVSQYSGNILLLQHLVENALKRLTRSVEWLLRYVLSLKKTKHSKQTSAKNESEELDKQIEQTIAVLQSQLETDAIEMIKQEEQSLEKELEDLRLATEKTSLIEEKQQKAFNVIKSHLVNQSASSTGMVHLASERIMHEHQTAVRKIQEDMERTKQHQLKLLQQKLQARKFQHQKMLSEATEQLLSLASDSLVARALLQLLMDVRLKRAEKELRKELEVEQKREWALLEARLNGKMKRKLKSQEVHMIQNMARVHHMSSDQLAAEIQEATAGMGGITEQIVSEMMQAFKTEGN